MIYLARHHLLPFLPPATNKYPPSDLKVLEILAPLARFLFLYAHPHLIQYALEAKRRVTSWGHFSSLVPFVFGAMLNDVETCSWALTVKRWEWYSPEGSTEKDSPVRQGAMGALTLDISSLPYAIDVMIPPPYRWALARASVEADLGGKGASQRLVARFKELLGAASGEQTGC